MDWHSQHQLTRRTLFSGTTLGLGAAALASLDSLGCAEETSASGLSGLPHHEPKAKRAIYLFMAGAPSQMDLWDPKPALSKRYDQELPESVREGQRLTTMTSGQTRFPIAPSQYKFKHHGRSGTAVSELLPHLATEVDEIALIRSMHTDAINHDPALTTICTGDQLPGKASLGSWLSYGLGTENQDLPAFLVMTASWSGRRQAQALYHRLWGNGFLPSKYQGVAIRQGADPVLYLSNPPGLDQRVRRRMLDTVGRLNRRTAESMGDPETQARIAQYEMAFRMQTSVPELTDIRDEPKYILDLYGRDVTTPGTFAHCCLMARRMAERGVRFTQIFHRGWDQHNSLPRELPRQCRDVDRASAALLKDLRQRDLLDETLVVWGGEFGRTTYCQGELSRNNYGRDHHPKCFSVWMAGGGTAGGVVHGETDEFSYNIAQDPVHVRDFNATILHLMGIDSDRLTYAFQGLDQRLTGVEGGTPVRAVMA
ncbi:MAG: DUF1501 domain-containing protein [Planctomycetota bacterium]